MDLNDEVLKTIIFLVFMRKLALVYAACRYLCYIIHQRQRLKRRSVPYIPTQSTIDILINLYLKLMKKDHLIYWAGGKQIKVSIPYFPLWLVKYYQFLFPQ